ncbi:MAG: AAA family ATPase [Nanoarchaeota archaeon]|nr:AAA family ATPase [Nanoarchaeota archaeon]MBU4116528.1 AAA family ATPase [Nanoarchaeota archaeon]
MILKKIILNNIRSYETQEINFSKGSTLLSGDIGAGKTSILLGIEFALFGLQPGQRGSSLLKNGKEEGGVLIEFEVDDQNIIVERTLKRGKTISQTYCAITINNEKKEFSVTELKSKILEILNYPKEFSKKQNILYKFTVYTPQEEMKQIILQDSETRINTLRHVFGIDKYKRILENISTINSKIREEKRLKQAITENLEQDKFNIIAKENELESKQYNLVSVEKELFLKQEKRKKIQEEQEEIAKKIQEKNKLEQEIEKTKIIMLNKRDSVSENERLIQRIKEQIDELSQLSFDESQIIELEEKINAIKKEKEKLDLVILEITSQINSIYSKIEDCEKLEKKISHLDICPTCLQNVEAVYRANVLNKLHNDVSEGIKKREILEQEKAKISKEIIRNNEEFNFNQKKLEELKILRLKLQDIDEKQKRIQEIQISQISLKNDLNLLEKHMELLNNSIFELKKFDDIFKLKQDELRQALNSEREVDIKVAELKKEIDMFSMQINELKEKLKKIEEIQKDLEYLAKLEDWLSKSFMPVISFIEKNVMIKLKSEFSKLFSEWFCMLVSDNFDVQLDDNFTPIIEHQDYEIDYAYLSGGERTAVALAYRLALNQVINSLLSKIKTKGLMILDEPTDGFSDQQLDKMRDVLLQLNVEQLIIVSHEQKIEGFVENVVRFKKENSISKIDKDF